MLIGGIDLSGRKVLVTGGAGFIGSHVVDRLVQMGNVVTVFDNLSSGRMEFINHHLENPNFTLIEGDLLNTAEIEAACKDMDIVFHIAANPDVKLGVTDTKVHFDQNITATYNVKNLAYISIIYGESIGISTSSIRMSTY